MLNLAEKNILLDLARSSIRGQVTNPGNIPNSLKDPCGVFITLKKHNKLRGCIGYIEPVASLYQAVIECAHRAAYCDSRFVPVEKNEIGLLNIEISILSKPEPLAFASPDDLFEKLDKNFGVIIKKDIHSATFLPQVWKELPDKKDFLSHLCLKAGLFPDAWKENGDLKVFRYTVEKFCEK